MKLTIFRKSQFMKKVLFIVALGTLFVSCSRKYTCECTDGSQNVVHTEDIKAKNDAEAKEKCAALGIECYCEH